MSSKVSGRKFHKNYFMLELELSDIVVSFKELFGLIRTENIYSGKEELAFKDKNLEFQKILLSEFAT